MDAVGVEICLRDLVSDPILHRSSSKRNVGGSLGFFPGRVLCVHELRATSADQDAILCLI